MSATNKCSQLSNVTRFVTPDHTLIEFGSNQINESWYPSKHSLIKAFLNHSQRKEMANASNAEMNAVASKLASFSIDNGKTPISKLMELCARHKYKIEWGNIDEITLLNNTKNFTANLIVHGKNYTGEGKKKQLAKQNAAENALEDLEKNPLSVNSSTMVSSPASASSSTLNETNPVSKLMELCAQNRLSAPEFTLIYESKPPQTPFFTIACSIKAMNILTQGSESSKKAAKKKAAEEALKEIESKGFLKELESRKGRSLKNDTVDGDIESSPTMAHIKTKFLEECEGLALDPTCFDCLRDKDSAFDYDMYLQDLAKKVNCKVEYLDFSETKFLRVNRCVCQLISEEYQVPVLTAMAKSEVNYEEAKILASKRALLMLLISTYQFT